MSATELDLSASLLDQPHHDGSEVYVAERLRKKGYAVWPVMPGGAFSMNGDKQF